MEKIILETKKETDNKESITLFKNAQFDNWTIKVFAEEVDVKVMDRLVELNREMAKRFRAEKE